LSNNIVITSDSTTDLSPELRERYNIQVLPLGVTLGDKTYFDGVDVTPDDIYAYHDKTGTLPKTCAANVSDCIDFFKKFVDEGYEVVHINLGSALSSSHKNAVLAAEELEGVYAVDSCNLSTGIGHLVVRAGQLIEQGLSAKEVAEQVSAMAKKVHSSFVLDTLKFMAAGGRCSTVVALGANLLNLKPCIQVNNADGSMTVGKKFRGKLDKVLEQYVEEELSKYENIDDSLVFVTHSGIDESYIEVVKNAIERVHPFKEVHTTIASCSISCHCGPNTLGILFMTK